MLRLLCGFHLLRLPLLRFGRLLMLLLRRSLLLLLLRGSLLLLLLPGGVPFSDPYGASPETSAKWECERAGGYWHSIQAVCERGAAEPTTSSRTPCDRT